MAGAQRETLFCPCAHGPSRPGKLLKQNLHSGIHKAPLQGLEPTSTPIFKHFPIYDNAIIFCNILESEKNLTQTAVLSFGFQILIAKLSLF